MTENRLSIETRAGAPSLSDTFAKLLEYLRLAEESCYTIGHLYKADDDWVRGQGFLAIGQMLGLTIKNVLKLATRKGSQLQ